MVFAFVMIFSIAFKSIPDIAYVYCGKITKNKKMKKSSKKALTKRDVSGILLKLSRESAIDEPGSEPSRVIEN